MMSPASSSRDDVRPFISPCSVPLASIVWSASSPHTPAAAPDILSDLRIGLRTFYRELELLKRCGVKVRHKTKLYHLLATAEEAEGRLPFPDPQLSFAEMAELARCDCPAGQPLADLLVSVINPAEPPGDDTSRARREMCLAAARYLRRTGKASRIREDRAERRAK